MNLTLGTLAELKSHLLTAALREGTDYDAAIANLGAGVAEMFEARCNRRFARVVDDVAQFSADRDHVSLPRYPVETVTKIESRASLTAGWVDVGAVDAIVQNIAADSGLVWFETEPGTWREQIRLTYTGGYWFDESSDGAVVLRNTYKQGSIALLPGAESEVIEFAQAFAAPSASVVVSVSVVLPAGGTGITVNPSAVTNEGFTAVLGFPIPGAGYTLRWSASIETQGALPSGSLPDGATPRPNDLFFAWLMQCSAIWSMQDVLGTDIAKDRAGVSPSLTLAGVQLVPAVVETLRGYTRRNLL